MSVFVILSEQEWDLQNLLITDNAWFFENFYLSWKTSLIVFEWAWAWQSS